MFIKKYDELLSVYKDTLFTVKYINSIINGINNINDYFIYKEIIEINKLKVLKNLQKINTLLQYLSLTNEEEQIFADFISYDNTTLNGRLSIFAEKEINTNLGDIKLRTVDDYFQVIFFIFIIIAIPAILGAIAFIIVLFFLLFFVGNIVKFFRELKNSGKKDKVLSKDLVLKILFNKFYIINSNLITNDTITYREFSSLLYDKYNNTLKYIDNNYSKFLDLYGTVNSTLSYMNNNTSIDLYCSTTKKLESVNFELLDTGLYYISHNKLYVQEGKYYSNNALLNMDDIIPIKYHNRLMYLIFIVGVYLQIKSIDSVEKIYTGDLIDELTPYEFEKFVALLFRQLGYKTKVTRGSGDNGVDIFLKDNNGFTYIVQCKKYKKTVGPSYVRDLIGTMKYYGAYKGFLVTTGTFSKNTIDTFKGQVTLIDKKKLMELIFSNDIDLLKLINEL